MAAQRLTLQACSSKTAFLKALEARFEHGRFLRRGALAASRPLKSVLAQLFAPGLGCKTILIQFPIHERDFSSEYSTYYAKTFRSYPRFCARVHFFAAARRDDETALAFLDRMVADERAYLGFTTFRPVDSACVGRTVIRHDPDRFFLTVRHRTTTRIAGVELAADGAPFIQQDSAVGMCAQASIWMALNAVNGHHRKEPVTLADISRAAYEGDAEGRVLPARDGMTLRQIAHALFRFGYHAISINCEPNRSDKSADADPDASARRIDYIRASLYPYVESGVPVILVIQPAVGDLHAVVLVGHDWQPHAAGVRSRTITIRSHLDDKGEPLRVRFTSPTSFIGRFFVNNDNTGPYQALEDRGSGYSLSNVQVAYPVLHQSVFMTAEEALRTVDQYLPDLLVGTLKERGCPLSLMADRLVLRPYLQRRHEFRRWATRHTVGIVQERYRLAFLPSHLWVVEFHEVSTFSEVGSKPQTPCRLGEIVIDATGDPDDHPLLLLRIAAELFTDGSPGVLIDMSDEDRPWSVTRVDHPPRGINGAVCD